MLQHRVISLLGVMTDGREPSGSVWVLPVPLHHDQGPLCPVGCSLPAGGGASGAGDGGNAD